MGLKMGTGMDKDTDIFVFGVSDSFYCPEFRVWVQPLGLLSRLLTCYVNAY